MDPVTTAVGFAASIVPLVLILVTVRLIWDIAKSASHLEDKMDEIIALLTQNSPQDSTQNPAQDAAQGPKRD